MRMYGNFSVIGNNFHAVDLMTEQIIAILYKDFLIEIRQKESLLSIVCFTSLSLVLLRFAFDRDAQEVALMAPGMLWSVFLTAGTLAINKQVSQETIDRRIDLLLSAPIDRGVLFFSKLFANFFFLLLTLIIMMFFLCVAFSIFPQSFLWLIAILVFGLLGFSAVAVLLSTITAQVPGREILLPILVFPLAVPGLISAVKISNYIFFSGSELEFFSWWKLLLIFDTFLVAASWLSFEVILD